MKAHEELVRKMFKTRGYIDGKDYEALHAAVGLAGEAGEVLDIIKKVAFMGKPLDSTKLKKELGDVEFYLRALYRAYGIDRDTVLQMNIDKLTDRHPSGNVEEFYKQ